MAAEGQVIYISNHRVCKSNLCKGGKNFRNECLMDNKNACCITCPHNEKCFFECSSSLKYRSDDIECDKWEVVK